MRVARKQSPTIETGMVSALHVLWRVPEGGRTVSYSHVWPRRHPVCRSEVNEDTANKSPTNVSVDTGNPMSTWTVALQLILGKQKICDAIYIDIWDDVVALAEQLLL